MFKTRFLEEILEKAISIVIYQIPGALIFFFQKNLMESLEEFLMQSLREFLLLSLENILNDILNETLGGISWEVRKNHYMNS